jgi:hypothetical protein
MSLAMYAAPFDDDDNQQVKEDNTIARKRTSNNRTQKRVPKENQYSEKVNSVLQSIHSYNEDTDQLSDFKPIPPPISAGVEQTRIRENMENMQDPSSNTTSTSMGTSTIEGFYQKHIPNHRSSYNFPYYQKPAETSYPQYDGLSNMNYTTDSSGNDSILIDKLNYMIKLLEEQQDERTSNVTEEVVLYCFLGIFIIFIVDSFVRVGKYVR